MSRSKKTGSTPKGFGNDRRCWRPAMLALSTEFGRLFVQPQASNSIIVCTSQF